MSNRRYRSRRNKWLAAGAIAASAVLLVIALGFYPIAIVNGHFVWANNFRAYVGSALAYQQAAHDTYSASSTDDLVTASAQGEAALGAAALDELVEQQLINQGLEKLVGENTNRLVTMKLEQLLKEPDLPGASRALFQLDPTAFTNAILRPQAAREVLSGRIYIDNQTLEGWVTEARKSAKIRMLSSTYRWDGEHVQVK